MATATQTARAPTGERRDVYRCECGHVLRVVGGGRHRVYFEPDNGGLDDPVMNRACPACGRGLSEGTDRSDRRATKDHDYLVREDRL